MGLLERLQSKNQNDVQTGNEQEPAPLLEAEKLQKPKQPAPESVKPATKQKKIIVKRQKQTVITRN